MPTTGTATADACVTAAAGHPRALYYLAFTEAWERFSFYGMSALLVLYMVDQLLLPGHAEHVAALATLRHALQAVSGPLSTQAFASQIFGLYSGLVYFTPLVGGIIADRWIGQRNAVVIGALAMAAGHLCMAFEQSFLGALLLLITGSGLLKGNIASQVGSLYPAEDEARRARGFVIFSTAINLGAVLGPLVCGYLAERHSWQAGFATAALFMLAGLVTYLLGYRKYPPRVQSERTASAKLTAADWRTVRALLVVVIITIAISIAYYQFYDVAPVWMQARVTSELIGVHIPIPWYQSLNALTSMVAVPLLLWLWKREGQRHRESDDLGKIAMGAWFMAAANLVLVLGTWWSGGGRISPLWPTLYEIALGIGFLFYWPTLLALISQAAPAAVNATLMGFGYLSLFVANMLIGWIGGWYERMSPSAFWTLHAALAIGGGVGIILAGPRLRRTFAHSTERLHSEA